MKWILPVLFALLVGAAPIDVAAQMENGTTDEEMVEVTHGGYGAVAGALSMSIFAGLITNTARFLYQPPPGVDCQVEPKKCRPTALDHILVALTLGASVTGVYFAGFGAQKFTEWKDWNPVLGWSLAGAYLGLPTGILLQDAIPDFNPDWLRASLGILTAAGSAVGGAFAFRAIAKQRGHAWPEFGFGSGAMLTGLTVSVLVDPNTDLAPIIGGLASVLAASTAYLVFPEMTERYADLPMYDFPEVRSATTGIWGEIREALRAVGVDAPQTLGGDGDRLAFGQVCGIEVARSEQFPRSLVGTPVYQFDGCEGPRHRAFVVAREADDRSLYEFRGSRAAINEPGSNTGTNLFRVTVGEALDTFFDSVAETGSHRDSLAAVRRGAVEIASIDAVTFGLLARHAPESVAGVRVVAESPLVPAPPFVSDLEGEEFAALRRAVRHALTGSDHAAALGLAGLEPLDVSDYDVIGQL